MLTAAETHAGSRETRLLVSHLPVRIAQEYLGAVAVDTPAVARFGPPDRAVDSPEPAADERLHAHLVHAACPRVLERQDALWLKEQHRERVRVEARLLPRPRRPGR